MKLQILSDYHLEFYPTTKIRNVGSDVLVMAGDIVTVKGLLNNEFDDFFEYISTQFKDLIYVLGNHEHYNYTFNKSVDDLRNYLSKYSNIHVLDDQSIEINNVKFIGSTLWTDVNNNCPITIEALKNYLNDFRLINYINEFGNYKVFHPTTAALLHSHSKQFIKQQTVDHEKCVVVTHHAPSYRSIHEKYKCDKYMNHGYASYLEDMMIDNIKVWIHGHVHSPSDYIVNNTRVVCNPHGYRNEGVKYKGDLVVEI